MLRSKMEITMIEYLAPERAAVIKSICGVGGNDSSLVFPGRRLLGVVAFCEGVAG